jgi:hypothetical protein
MVETIDHDIQSHTSIGGDPMAAAHAPTPTLLVLS